MPDAAAANAEQTSPAAAHSEPALPLRGNTFLGVCEAMGQDFGIPADLIRIAFAALFFWNMAWGVGAYLGIGAVIALSRWLYPRATSDSSEPAAVEPSDTPAEDEQEEEKDELSMAA